jgi:hypothetical protein
MVFDDDDKEPLLPMIPPNKLKLRAAAAMALAAAGLWFAPIAARAATPTPSPMPSAPANFHCEALDRRRECALGMLETGNDDREIGGAGEVSRYQIMPAVWRRYSASRNYVNSQVALAVARKHWAALELAFYRQTGREPTDFDMYVLWNTHYGYYAGRKFDPARLSPVVRDRAQRFVNLVQCGDL